jgi:hypothetical protein
MLMLGIEKPPYVSYTGQKGLAYVTVVMGMERNKKITLVIDK